MAVKILLVDNYDSFTYNLLHYLQIANAEVDIYRNDVPQALSQAGGYDALVISPGPSRPANSGFPMELVKSAYRQKPILGVCLGMQIINEAFGGRTIKAPYPIHGKSSKIRVINKSNIFDGIPAEFTGARYHSLICSDVSYPLKVTAVYENIPMAFHHVKRPVYGLQFHPESFLTDIGLTIIKNFIAEIK